MYKLCDGVLKQRDFRIGEETRLIDYFKSDMVDSEIKDNPGLPIYVFLRDEKIFELNVAGSIVFEGMCEGKSKSAICQDLAELFNVDDNDVESDVEAFISTIIDKKILVDY